MHSQVNTLYKTNVNFSQQKLCFMHFLITFSVCGFKANVIESSKIEKKLSKTASVLLASKEQKENDVPRSDDEDEKRSQTHKGYHTIKKSIGDLSLELAKVHVSAESDVR